MTSPRTQDTIASGIARMNALGVEGTPFLFVIDYSMQLPLFLPLEGIDPNKIRFDINGFTNAGEYVKAESILFEKSPVSLSQYAQAFDRVQKELVYGNSFLLNLTFSTPVELNLTLRQVFDATRAKYKLYLDEQLVVFSPEIFVRIRDGRIFSHPMKGTIDASVPNARKLILQNAKETSEHITIVDLIRNDLSRVARDVRVDQFRYIDEVKTHQKTLLQVSSEISGDLPQDYCERLGDIIYALLPAGSISGAPKHKTVEIIANVETHQRGYFTGVFGYFDGKNLDSGVMIRFIEKQGNQLIYKSGGGITAQSKLEEEYQEMLDKVYLPIL